MEQKKFFDVWFVQSNTVYGEVPFQVVTDWAQQARLSADDMIKPSGTANWFKLGSMPLFEAYLPRPEPARVVSPDEPPEAIELDFDWKKRYDDEDDDVDMIPLIDISLVLLIFFMMTTTVAAVSRIAVPQMTNAVQIETSSDVIRIDIDRTRGGHVLYGVGRGTSAPAPEDSDITDEVHLINRVKAHLYAFQNPPKVRIAAHGDLEYEIVSSVMRRLDALRDENQIEGYHIEVNEKPAR